MMGMFLNSIVPLENYKNIAKTRFFVDKTLLIDKIIHSMENDACRFLCITRPRRFGKSVMANMLGAFFGKAGDGREVFRKLSISKSVNFEKYLNSYDVIYIDCSEIPRDCKNYKQYINRIQNGINQDLADAYPEYGITPEGAVWEYMIKIFQQTKQKFLFIIDEWDAVFHMPFISEDDKQEYLLFLKTLLKDKAYVQLAYMTGILPIAKYSSGSELNMFREYDMVTRIKYGEYFGFLEAEVDTLFDVYQKTTDNPEIKRADLDTWYDGYYTKKGVKLYNPCSVVCALEDNELANYWNSSGPYDEIFYYIRNNIDAVRDDLAFMISGERISIKLQGYAATKTELHTRDQIYSAMVVYGLLTYSNGEVFIPNKELMDKFDELLLTNEDLGYIYRLAKESERMIKATFAGDTNTMESILKYVHDTESPILSYNSEIELSAVVNLVYLSARDRYRVEREDKAGEGYVDFIFYPEQRNADALILELKIDSTPEEAIQQIRNKNYILRFKGKLGEKPKFTGKILAVGISYSKKTKEHRCKVETISQKSPGRHPETL